LGNGNNLYSVFNHFMKVRTECKYCVMNKYKASELTIKQIEYLRKFDEYDFVTISKLAEELNLSKPSITEMVKRFIRLNCLKKEQCGHDARVYYLFLTERGKAIARMERIALEDFIGRVEDSLNEEEINDLVEILSKIG